MRDETMRRRFSRRRRLLKRTGLVACLLMLTIWGLSYWWWGYLHGHRISVFVGRGCVEVYLLSRALDIECEVFRGNVVDQAFWLPRKGRPNFGAYTGIGIAMPIWILCLPLCLALAVIWWRDRSHQADHCQTCGYDLTGNTSGRCPECGASL